MFFFNPIKATIVNNLKTGISTSFKRYRHEVSKAIIYDTKTLEDGSKFISRVPSMEPKLSQLPPALNLKGPKGNFRQLTDMEIKEMQRLRLEDPALWTRSKLAKKFNCAERQVYLKAKANHEYHQCLQEKQKLEWQKLGFKRQLIFINRQRRRAEW
ncbi:hypothetical protein K502DRAFT_218887 [Neoconidiobolus thromboides FSU 785]|nr:hypothetical protein K502DRAFT_218887 [Neoconidiobolus thromboides FSU 785]